VSYTPTTKSNYRRVALPLVSHSIPTLISLPSRSARHRYLETLFLPEVLAPLARLADESINEPSLLLSLTEIEQRHRRSIAPLIHALTSVQTQEARLAKTEDASKALQADEVSVITAALSLRRGCRAVEEGDGLVHPRKLIEELEKRE
jgi:hypothetical protein